MSLFILIIEGGTEISQDGPFKDETERLVAARRIWSDLDSHKGDNLFRLDIDGDVASTGVFLEGELD